MASIFTKIVAGEIPSAKVAETENEIAFLDIAPWAKGHTLVVPKAETPKLEELSEEDAKSLMGFLQRVVRAVSEARGGVDCNVLLNNGPGAGQEVPHVHFHVVPRGDDPDFRFGRRLSYADGEAASVAEEIAAKFK